MDLGIKQWIEQCMSQNPELAKKLIRENAILIERIKGIVSSGKDYKEMRTKLLQCISSSSDPNERALLTDVYQMCQHDKTKDDELGNEYKSFNDFYSQYSSVVEEKPK